MNSAQRAIAGLAVVVLTSPGCPDARRTHAVPIVTSSSADPHSYEVGALLVMSLLITPAAAAARVFTAPAATIFASVVFAELAAVGGLVLSLAPGVPVSVFVTAISFVIYLVCWGVGRRRAA